jgi:hypothetical protein
MIEGASASYRKRREEIAFTAYGIEMAEKKTQ